MNNFEVIKAIIDHIANNCEMLSKRRNNNTISFVKNERFSEGVYRLHTSNIIPQYLSSEKDIDNIIEELLQEEKYEKIAFDSFSGWLTIKQ